MKRRCNFERNTILKEQMYFVLCYCPITPLSFKGKKAKKEHVYGNWTEENRNVFLFFLTWLTSLPENGKLMAGHWLEIKHQRVLDSLKYVMDDNC
ncbi:hypothetical protein CEXT_381231 [Caerostris extrusa]|uniref:Uncharacterized protein n=1 Tax=Caerostris extrusa TaxID=172846 RepID=A0AAV4WU74_CAEEX|nr:hypothetical protein CEXT_381231 [Caerostris extrusa]